ncbi:NAD(P)/FAD-dependent oxidoreductase [Spirosoma flavum]|uniref:NAD(P)/FAD-dependent oxidoreductase n=1 Tax=Spirosoma flavum TaxID=2048557 RepID=A0ABW6ALY1_9BACT
MISKSPHIVVVGAGIVGASLAYHLVRKNARVTLIDKAPNSASGATEKSFAWITVTHDAPETYISLRQQAIADWHRVEDELKGQLNVDWSGALTWREDPAETVRMAGKLINSGYQVHLVDQQQIRLLEPNLKIVPAQAILAENEGAIDARLTTELLITAARQAGADCQLGNEVLSLMTNGSRITGVITANGKITADTVVLAAGVNTTTLCQPLDVTLPINISPAILIAFHTPHQFVNRIISNPFMDIRAASATLTLSAAEYTDESIENNPQAIAQRSLEQLKAHWQGAGQINVTNVMIGKRPIPQDGLPIIGRTPHIEGLYVSVMHAGVTLAAVAGRLAAGEILSDQDDFLLSSYRPSRFN